MWVVGWLMMGLVMVGWVVVVVVGGGLGGGWVGGDVTVGVGMVGAVGRVGGDGVWCWWNGGVVGWLGGWVVLVG